MTVLKAAQIFAVGFVIGHVVTRVVVPSGDGDKEPSVEASFALDKSQTQNDHQAPPPIRKIHRSPTDETSDPPWLTEEEMRASWLELRPPLNAMDLGITEADASWESWWNYWGDCYECVFCWLETPEPPLPTGPDPWDCIALGEGGVCDPRETAQWR